MRDSITDRVSRLSPIRLTTDTHVSLSRKHMPLSTKCSHIHSGSESVSPLPLSLLAPLPPRDCQSDWIVYTHIRISRLIVWLNCRANNCHSSSENRFDTVNHRIATIRRVIHHISVASIRSANERIGNNSVRNLDIICSSAFDISPHSHWIEMNFFCRSAIATPRVRRPKR